jgi:hypothetical protein
MSDESPEPIAVALSVYDGAGRFAAPGLRRSHVPGGYGSACRWAEYAEVL